MRIEGKLVFKRDGDKKASDFLNELVLEKSKEIKLTVPFEASGTFEKTPMQPDGITPIEVKEPNFKSVKLESKVEETKNIKQKEEVVKKVEPKKDVKVEKKTKKEVKKKK